MSDVEFIIEGIALVIASLGIGFTGAVMYHKLTHSNDDHFCI